MKDRLAFESTQLDNGMMVYSKQMDVPFATVRIYCPVGHFHNAGQVQRGTAHLLEHLCSGKSKLYPEKDEFLKNIDSDGGSFDMSTGFVTTEFGLDVGADRFEEGFKGLMSHVFDPMISPGDILHEVKIVANERKKINRWYPRKTELQNYLSTQWKNCSPTSIRQQLGEDTDLAQMSVEGIRDFHEGYFDPRTFLIVGGSFDPELVFRELGRIKTRPRAQSVDFNQIGWTRREFHTRQFEEQKRFEYYMGGIIEGRDKTVAVGMRLIGRLLTGFTNGGLLNWLRRELGWCYDMGFNFNTSDGFVHSDWQLRIPFDSLEQLELVRPQLRQKIVDSISDKRLVEAEIRRAARHRLFAFQTLGSILDAQESFLKCFGGLRTEADLSADEEQFLDVSRLLAIYEKYWTPELTGEFVATPKTSN